MWDKIIGLFKTTVIKDVGEIVDNLTTNDEEKSVAKEALASMVMDNLNKGLELQASVLQTEMTGNWLQRSWRPIVMLTFTSIVVIGAFKEIPYLDTFSPFWNLLELGLGGYVIGRSVEKVADTVTKNIDLPFVKKKERK